MSKKNISIRMNKEFILVSSVIEGMFFMTDPDQEFIFNSVDIADSDLGALARKKLDESKEIPAMAFSALFHTEKMQGLQKNLENKMKELYGYKTKRAIYKEMRFLFLKVRGENIIINPSHQNSLDGSKPVLNADGTELEFKYDIHISDEALGKAIREAFTYCTSIYRRG